ncbi:MAG: ABC transporter ATP-binding protein [Bacteroidales bacterium]|nr:ABC transporter ATP-binding protein [Bacteroidales bacterium]
MKNQSLIILKEITKIYRLDKVEVPALNGIDLEIQQGEFVAIMGPSGSGKSTLMNIIGCLDSPTSGEYYLHHKLVSNMDDRELARIRNAEIGFVFQTFNLLPRYTALENVALPLVYAGIPNAQREKRALQLLEMVGLLEWKNHKPNELSGGQKQRVAIARALINNPSIIIADEPTGNLDSKSSAEIMQLFQQIHARGNTIILVTHDEKIALYAQRLVQLMDGKIINDKPINQSSSISI